jgi:hypothetical protein
MIANDEDKIQSGAEIVAEFIAGLKSKIDEDGGAIASIQDLHGKGKLTKTNLMRALEERRSESNQKPDKGE